MSSPTPSSTPFQSAPAPAVASAAWQLDAIVALFNLPFHDLLYRAQQVHRAHFDPSEVELATLLSIKTGGCAEDCGYCPQSAHHEAGVKAQKMLELEAVLEAGRPGPASGGAPLRVGG